MMKKYKLMILIPITILSSTLTLFMENSLLIWILLEINTISFITLLTFNNQKNASIIYFLIQSFSSSIMLICMLILNLLIFGHLTIKLIFTLTLFMKMGMFPFYWWLLKIINNMNFNEMFMLTSFQKIPSLVLFFQLSKLNLILYSLIMLNLIFSTFSNLNHNKFKLILIYSSISHSSWLILLIYSNSHTWLMYFFLYTLISFLLFNLMNKLNLNSINSFSMIPLKFQWMFMLILLILCYMGLPIFSLFSMKWFSIFHLAKNSLLNMFSLMFILSSLMMIFCYFRMIYLFMFMKNINLKMTFLNLNFTNIFLFFILLSLILMLTF